MKFEMPLIAVKDIEVSKKFYQEVMGQTITVDLGANVTFMDAFAIQADYDQLIGETEFRIRHRSNDHELYFEEEDFDGFMRRLEQCKSIEYLHAPKEYPWGQRVVRFYDPDGHIIEVGESMACVCRKFHGQGMSVEEVANRVQHPEAVVRKFLAG